MTAKEERAKVKKFFEDYFKSSDSRIIRLPDEIMSIMRKRNITIDIQDGEHPEYKDLAIKMIFIPEKKPLDAPIYDSSEGPKFIFIDEDKPVGTPIDDYLDNAGTAKKSEKLVIKNPLHNKPHNNLQEPSLDTRAAIHVYPEVTSTTVNCHATYIFKGYNLKCNKKNGHNRYHVGQYTDAKGQKHAQSWGSLWDPEAVTGQ